MRRLAALTFVALSAVLAFSEKEAAPPPRPVAERAPWSRFGKGAWVKLKRSGTFAGKPWSEELVRTLVDIQEVRARTTEGCVACWTYTFDEAKDGGAAVRREEMVGEPPVEEPVATRELDGGYVEVDGRRVGCSVTEFTYKANAQGEEKVRTEWRSVVVKRNGGLIRAKNETVKRDAAGKVEWRRDGVEERMLDDDAKVTVAGRELSCCVIRTSGSDIVIAPAPPVVEEWLSPEVPGGVVKRVENGSGEAGAYSSAAELLDFGRGE